MSRPFPVMVRAWRGSPTFARAVRGFTLIELMLVVIVMAILAGVAYPSYVEQTRKSKRGQVKADLVEYAQLAERYHTTQNTYEGFTLPGGGSSVSSPREGGTAAYSVGFVGTQSVFTLSATAQGNQAKDKCGDLGINQANVKTSGGTLSECW